MEMNFDIIIKYFPNLSENQKNQLSKLYLLYKDWNAKINVISRKDIDNLYLHHVLHSMSILTFYKFNTGSKIIDIGTGGGFPGIPLAIMLEDCHFTLIDGKSKKIHVVNEIIDKLELKNVSALHQRAEEFKDKFDFAVVRAVATIDKLKDWSFPLLKQKSKGPMPSGLFAYKGGHISNEIKLLERNDYYENNHIFENITEDYFKEKYIVFVQK